MVGKTDGRQLRWDSHNQARRQHILDAAIGVLADAEPGVEVHVQQIADRAGLSRTVVYRHFTDRADLDAAVQGRALELLRAELVPALSFEGTPVEIIRRIVSAYVGWASRAPLAARVRAAGPARPGHRPDGDGDPADRRPDRGPHQRRRRGAERPARPRTTWPRSTRWSSGWSARCSPRRAAGWRRPEQKPDREKFVELVTEAVWLQIAGMAAARGVGARPRRAGRGAAGGGVRRGRRVSAADDQPVVQAGVGEADDLDRLWTPHRMAYIRGESKPADDSTGECPFCRVPSLTDEEGLVVHRGETGVRRAQPLPRRARPPHGLSLPARRRLHGDHRLRRPQRPANDQAVDDGDPLGVRRGRLQHRHEPGSHRGRRDSRTSPPARRPALARRPELHADHRAAPRPCPSCWRTPGSCWLRPGPEPTGIAVSASCGSCFSIGLAPFLEAASRFSARFSLIDFPDLADLL